MNARDQRTSDTLRGRAERLCDLGEIPFVAVWDLVQDVHASDIPTVPPDVPGDLGRTPASTLGEADLDHRQALEHLRSLIWPVGLAMHSRERNPGQAGDRPVEPLITAHLIDVRMHRQ